MAASLSTPSSSVLFSSAARATYRVSNTVSTTYRRQESSTFWHHHQGCQDWPTDEYRIVGLMPRSGEVCPECDRLKQLEFGPGGKGG